MDEFEQFVNTYYIEKGKDYVFVYMFTKVDGKYGLICHEIQARPNIAYVYHDFPTNEDDYLASFIPELCENCLGKRIGLTQYLELANKIERIYNLQEQVDNTIVKFVKHYGLE